MSSVCYTVFSNIFFLNLMVVLIVCLMVLKESYCNKGLKDRVSNVCSGYCCTVTGIVLCQGFKQGTLAEI